ncbi:macro domain-containing protein [Methylomonas sp. SURF-2]|uniref:Macro domain-containing protein n=1 Tax=Methylomonas subterranea TaxID=2952225 RepID=A0ABT1TFF9_9GAMM|nr:macro domain-containing protein [Methylomonas sp. SURF-2]MCQ8104204.1 macro domain-containing protein [Methylomonas sp. SURF-2]
MSVSTVQGDLLKQLDVDAIVNTVNCVGVMGKGIALQFKKKWPDNFKLYAEACKAGLVKPGQMFIYDAGLLATPKFIINFPTKDHWRRRSHIEFIQDGLVDLIAQIEARQITSIAIPPLGCGNGGLNWSDVKPLIEKAFAKLPDVDVRLFEPAGSPKAIEMQVNSARPKMTPGRAAILKVLETYRELNYGLSKIEVQKLAYFLQEAGENLRLQFVKHHYGPYADALRHALDRMDGHFIHGLGDGVVEAEIAPDQEALQEAERFIHQSQQRTLLEHIAKVDELIQGFQSPYGMELLSTVHWVATREQAESPESALELIQVWNSRKRHLMKPAHIEAAWQQLTELGWIKLPTDEARSH